ncbi:MAG: DUF3332 domain-containing protein, partial [Dysgonamonadaceae bacterium]|nr:DUF3332 domain-containing protein [Dysgonamonadaceae bacterium]
PVYGVAWFTDALVLNSIEFWSGENPAQTVNVQTKQLETENGLFIVTTNANGHTLQKAGTDEVVEFRFNKEANTWNLIVDEEIHPLLQFIDNRQALVYLADGSTMRVSLDEVGAMALRQVIETKAYFAVK